MAYKKGIKIVVQKRSAQNQVQQATKIKRKFQHMNNKTFIIVGTEKEESCNRRGKYKKKKKKKLVSEVSSKKHRTSSLAVHDAGSLPDTLFCRSKTFCNLPLVAENMLVKHLESNGLRTKIDNYLSSINYRTGVSDADYSAASSSSDKKSSPYRITENDGLLEWSEIFCNLPVVAEDMLVKNLLKQGISSKLDDLLFHQSGKINLPLAAKKILLKHLEKINSKNSRLGEETFILYLPYVEYWLNENAKAESFEEFEREVAVEFPSSFQWLLTECARMLQMTIQDLYYELLDVEAVYCYLFKSQGESLSKEMKKRIEKYW
jgi:hypothetical protein